MTAAYMGDVTGERRTTDALQRSPEESFDRLAPTIYEGSDYVAQPLSLSFWSHFSSFDTRAHSSSYTSRAKKIVKPHRLLSSTHGD